MFRPIALAALTLLLAVPAAPALAQDDFTRQLIDQCVGCRFPKDLHGRDLHGLRFVGADLRGVDFSHANLNGAVFTGCDLENAKFDDADLRNVRFIGAQLSSASFARAKMDGVTLRGADLAPRSSRSTSYRLPVIRDLDIYAGAYAEAYSGAYAAEVREQIARVLRDLAEHPPVISPDVQLQLRELAAHPPVLSSDLRRELRDLEREIRDERLRFGSPPR
ncbi:MAG TPA: pentapeptide repeat-containing protein [Candidatus Elarobacter sp.]|nr:pentapeptide repeat-containing protein [Candidatus Elarobacter sp.]